MLERILPYETNLFFLINGSHTYFTDCIMWLFSGSAVWIPIAVFLIFFLVYRKKWTEWLPLLIAIAILFICCDQFSSSLIKPAFTRLRPTHYPEMMDHVRTLYGYTGGQYGFLSGHATNSFGFAMFTSLVFRKKIYSISIFIWAVIMAYSRIYLGVHFVSDVIAGAISGITIGYIVFKLYILATNKIFNKNGFYTAANYSGNQVTVISIVIVSYILLFSFLSEWLIVFLSQIAVW